MKRIALLLAGIVFMSGTAIGESRLGPFVSWITDDDEDAFGGGLKYEWLLNGNFGLDLRASYLELDESDVYIIPIELGVVGVLKIEGLSLHAGAGGGYYIPEDTSVSTPWGDVDGPDAEFGFYAVAGLRLALSENVELFAEAKYTKVDSDEETRGDYWKNGNTYVVSETTKLGIDIDAFGANAGILLKF